MGMRHAYFRSLGPAIVRVDDSKSIFFATHFSFGFFLAIIVIFTQYSLLNIHNYFFEYKMYPIYIYTCTYLPK